MAKMTNDGLLFTNLIIEVVADCPEDRLGTILLVVVGRVRDCLHRNAAWLNSNGRSSLDSDQTPESGLSLLPVSASPL